MRSKAQNRLAILLITITLLVSSVFLYLFQVFNDFDSVTSLHWENKSDYKFKNTPSWFTYHSDSLFVRRAIQDEDKSVLLALYQKDSLGYDNYNRALDRLQFESLKKTSPAWLLFLLCALATCMGVMTQSLWAFVRHYSYRENLDVEQWWPWYWLRPFIGILASIMFVLLYQSGIYSGNVNYQSNSGSLLLIGLNVLIGIGLNDFIQRLRVISKAVFGETKLKKERNQKK